MPYAHGEVIRSDELQRGFEEAGRATAQAERRVAEAAARVRMAALNIAACRERFPADTLAGEVSVMRLPLVAGAGCEMVGPCVVTERVRTRSSIPYKPEGVGEVLLLEKDALWARLHDDRIATFEARLEPAYLTRYNELFIPVTSGQVSVTLFDSRGQKSFAQVKNSTLFRLDEREFNGRVLIKSVAEAGMDGKWIHAMGGLQLSLSDWMTMGEAKAFMTAKATTTYNLQEVRLWPTGDTVDFSVFVDGAEQDPTSVSVSSGDTLEVRVPVSSSTCARGVEIELG